MWAPLVGLFGPTILCAPKFPFACHGCLAILSFHGIRYLPHQPVGANLFMRQDAPAWQHVHIELRTTGFVTLDKHHFYV